MAAPPSAEPAAFVFIKRVCPDAPLIGETFAELELLREVANVARLAATTCAAFPHWGVHAGQVRLALVAGRSEDEPGEAAESAALVTGMLQPA